MVSDLEMTIICQGIRHADQEVEFLVQQVRHLCHERKSIRQDAGIFIGATRGFARGFSQGSDRIDLQMDDIV